MQPLKPEGAPAQASAFEPAEARVMVGAGCRVLQQLIQKLHEQLLQQQQQLQAAPEMLSRLHQQQSSR